jgi:hypothetical protein
VLKESCTRRSVGVSTRWSFILINC